jgi:hypothetical protein
MHVSKKPWYKNIRKLSWFAYFNYLWVLLLLSFTCALIVYFTKVKNTNKTCQNSALQILDSINYHFNNCCTCPKLPIFGLEWETTLNNPCSDSSWVITDNNTQLRFNIEDSKNCGGNCNATQSGTAIANITVGEKDVFLNLEFFGIGELQESNYEKIKFTLDDQMIADAHAAGGGKGCQFGPVIKNYFVQAPYKLLKGTKHKLEVYFTTNDKFFHKDCFYQVNLSFNY